MLKKIEYVRVGKDKPKYDSKVTGYEIEIVELSEFEFALIEQLKEISSKLGVK